VLSVLLVLGLLMGGFGCAAPAPTPSPTPTPVAPITLRLGHMLPIGNTYRNIADQWAKDFGEATEGRLTIETFQMSEVGMTGFDTLSSLEGRTIDIGVNLCSYLGSEYPPFGAIELPFLERNRAEAWVGEAALFYWAADKLAQYNVATLASTASVSPALLLSKEPVKTLDDFKGLKVRVFSPEQGDLVSAAGATPVSMPFGEQYVALQRGILTAVITAISGSYEAKFYEVLEYAYKGPPFFSYGAISMYINKDAWNELPADLQVILQREAERHAYLVRASSIRQDEEGYANWAKVATLDELSPEVLKGLEEISREKVWPGWVERTGPEGKEALDLLLTTWGRY